MTNEPYSPRQTARLTLSPPTLADADDLQVAIDYEAIAANTLNIPYPYPDDGAQHWIESLDPERGTQFPFLLRLKTNSTLIGSAGININTNHHHGEVGYWISQPYWGNGYASEALREILRFGFLDRGLNRIFGRYFTDNPTSGRVMEKVGMQYEGTLRQHVRKWDEYKDLAVRSILRNEWRDQQT